MYNVLLMKGERMNLHLKTTLVVGGSIAAFFLTCYIITVIPILNAVFPYVSLVLILVAFLVLMYLMVYDHLKDKQKWRKLNNE